MHISRNYIFQFLPLFFFQHSYNLFVGSFYDDLLFDPAGLLFSNRTNKVGKLGGIIRRMNGHSFHNIIY